MRESKKKNRQILGLLHPSKAKPILYGLPIQTYYYKEIEMIIKIFSKAQAQMDSEELFQTFKVMLLVILLKLFQ